MKIGLVTTSDYGPKLAPLDQKARALWAADCAEHVLPNFEKKRAKDDRPRKAIEAARAWARGEITMMMARKAAVQAHAAARAARNPGSITAARAAGHAAATAHSIRHALGAPIYAIVSVAANAAADNRDAAVSVEREWQLARLDRRVRRTGN
jgi:hypothetical protein